MSSNEKLREEEAKLQATLKAAEARHSDLSKIIDELRREMDGLRVKFKSATSQVDADRVNIRMYNLSRRMGPVENQLLEAEKAIKGAKNALEIIQRRIREAQTSGRGKWVVEYRREG